MRPTSYMRSFVDRNVVMRRIPVPNSRRLPLLAWFDSPSGPRPPHFRGFVITLRRGLRGTTVYASRHRVYWLLKSLASKSERVKLKSLQLYSLLAG